MGKEIRVLIVEDCEDDAILLVRELRRAGNTPTWERVETATSMHEAFRAATWDIVISDFSMPGFSGLEALRIAKEKDPDIPFIIVSGRIGEDVATNAMRAGAQDYIMKDNLARLLPAIERELREATGRRQHRKMELKLQQSQKMEALGQLASCIAHDFNNLLSAIGGSADLLRFILQPKGVGVKELATIRRTVRRGAELTQRLLAVGRGQMLQMANLDLNAMIRKEVTILRRVIPESVAIEFSPGASPATVFADQAQISQVLMNLCVNSRDAMNGDGTITIETFPVEIDSRLSGFGEGQDGPHVCISVADTGAGMDRKTAAHIFEPFFSTKEDSKGTGLGLATVYGIVRQHNGTIDVESELGQGTKFVIFLPLIDAQTDAMEDSDELMAVGGNETILVVEDDDDVRRSVVGMLSCLGYNMFEAPDGDQGLEVIKREGEKIDLVLSDVVMPNMGGHELFIRSRNLPLHLCFLFSSGHAKDNQFSEDEDAHFIAKPYTMEQLAYKIREILSPAPPPGSAGSY